MTLTAENITALTALLPLDWHEFRKKAVSKDKSKAQWLVYIDQTALTPFLSNIDPEFAYSIIRYEVHAGFVSCHVRLTICGVTRDGIGGDSPNGAQVTEDTVKGAETDAFKRAALRFGVGLYLRHTPMMWIPEADDYDKAAKIEAEKRFTDWYRKEFTNGATPTRAQGAQSNTHDSGETKNGKSQEGGKTGEIRAYLCNAAETGLDDEGRPSLRLKDGSGKTITVIDTTKHLQGLIPESVLKSLGGMGFHPLKSTLNVYINSVGTFVKAEKA